MPLPRKVRREINEKVLGLEELNLSRLSPEDFFEKLRKVNNHLDGNGVSPGSEYRNRVRLAEEAAKRYFEKRKSVEIPCSSIIPTSSTAVQHQTTYKGYLGKYFLEITSKSTGFFVRSNYHGIKVNGIQLEWRFNDAGRIESLGFSLSPEDLKGNLIVVEEDTTRPKNWTNARASYYPIPERIFYINANLGFLEGERKYGTMIQWGHINSRKILEGLVLERISDPAQFNGCLSLMDLVDNPIVMDVLGKITEIFPFTSNLEEGKLEIIYRPNRFKARGQLQESLTEYEHSE